MDDFPFGKEFEKEMFPEKSPLYGKHAKNMMKTDVRETDDSYEVDIDLPGFKKDEVNVKLEDGYITISAAKGLDKDEKDKKNGKYIRRERYAGSMSRSFYVGDGISQKDIHAKYESGILRLTLPKKAPEAIEKSEATKKVEVKFRPKTEGISKFYAEVVLDGDQNLSNNRTPSIELPVIDKENAVWSKVVTSKKDESVDTHGPVVYFSTYDHTEHIYYAKEIKGVAGDQIMRIGYSYSGNDNLKDRTAESKVQVYMGHTTKKGFESAADGMSKDDLTLVYDGTMVLEPGQDNMLIFNLDTPFEYDPTQNLVIVIDREGEVPSEQMFCALFDVFSANPNSGVNRSLSFSESFSYTAGKASLWDSAALLYLAVENPTGITSTKVLGTQFSYDGASGVLSVDDAVRNVAVHSVDGMLVKSADVKGGQLYLGLAKGVYVVRMTTVDGKQSNVKLYVTK